MHALCTVITKNVQNINNIIDNRCEGGDWDYASIGGRYDRIIPVSPKVKDLFEGHNFPFNHDEYAENGFPFHVIENNLNCKYVSIARIRNINREEVSRLDRANLINPLHPYSYILEGDDGCASEEIVVDNEGLDRLLDYVNDPKHSYYYLAIIDYHI